MKNTNWKKYGLEFVSIFVAVVSAFALNNWSNNRSDAQSEEKILTEIKNGIGVDINDFESNVNGHTSSLKANQIFRDLISNKPVSQDSIGFFYTSLFRDYSPLTNRSGYESLKEAGLKTVTNDSLRWQIIKLYDYYYGIIDILDNVQEMQSFENYFSAMNALLHPYMEFDESGNLRKINSPIGLSKAERKEILSYIWRLESNRKFKLGRYKLIINEMKKVKKSIEVELSE